MCNQENILKIPSIFIRHRWTFAWIKEMCAILFCNLQLGFSSLHFKLWANISHSAAAQIKTSEFMSEMCQWDYVSLQIIFYFDRQNSVPLNQLPVFLSIRKISEKVGAAFNATKKLETFPFTPFKPEIKPNCSIVFMC